MNLASAHDNTHGGYMTVNTTVNNVDKCRDYSYTEKLSLGTVTLSTLYMLPMAAQAAVVSVTTPSSIFIDDARFSNYAPIDWDVDGNSVVDFRLEAFRTIAYSSSSGTSGGGYGLSRPYGSITLGSNGALGGQGMLQGAGAGASDIANLSLGATVGSTPDAALQWGAPVNRALMLSSDYSGFATTSLYGAGNLIGFRFLGDAGQTLYGWAEISVDELALSVTIEQWAYEDSGSSIRVGEVPLPPAFLTMLSGLALGAGGLLRGRRKKQAVQDKAADNAC